MFTGHFAVALAAAGRERRLPMGLLIAAAFCGDLTEAVVAAFNVNDPTRIYSHSLPATVLTGVALGAAWLAFGGSRREALVLVIAAASHTALDFITAVKTLVPGVHPMGLGLYAHPIPEYAIEIAAVVWGWRMWRAAVPASPGRGRETTAMLMILVLAQTLVLVGVMYFGPDLATEGMSKFVR